MTTEDRKEDGNNPWWPRRGPSQIGQPPQTSSTLQDLISKKREEFEQMPWGITRAVNVDVVGEKQGIQVPAREEVKLFLTTTITEAYEEGRRAEMERVIEILKEAERDEWHQSNEAQDVLGYMRTKFLSTPPTNTNRRP